eukprot:scaffold2123_cov96-Cylindrotheca_fusiformis.AAC.14
MEFRSLCHELAQYDLDVLALQETNLNTGEFRHRDKLKEILQQEFGMVKLVTACTPIRTDSAYKPGGVMLAIVGPSTHRVVETKADPYGRWCSATLTGKDHRLIHIYSIYQSVDQPDGFSGTRTYYDQQWEILKMADHTDPKPRQQLIDDLSAELRQRRKPQTDFILLGDFNETVGMDMTLMASICASFQLVDAVTARHPTCYNTPTYNRGSRRLDYGLISATLLPLLRESGLNQFQEVSTSDHRAVFLQLDKHELFQTGNPV